MTWLRRGAASSLQAGVSANALSHSCYEDSPDRDRAPIYELDVVNTLIRYPFSLIVVFAFLYFLYIYISTGTSLAMAHIKALSSRAIAVTTNCLVLFLLIICR